MDHQPVGHLQRHLGQVLVGPMDGVARLEAHHPAPALLGEDGARLGRRATVRRERRIGRAISTVTSPPR